MRRCMLSILGVVGLIGFINCGELGAMHGWRRNSSQERVDNNAYQARLLPTRRAETRQNGNSEQRSFFNGERTSFLKEKFERGIKWIGVGCVAVFEGLGRTLGVIGGAAVLIGGTTMSVVASVFTFGTTLRAIQGTARSAAEIFDYTMNANSITKSCVNSWGLR